MKVQSLGQILFEKDNTALTNNVHKVHSPNKIKGTFLHFNLSLKVISGIIGGYILFGKLVQEGHQKVPLVENKPSGFAAK